ncbi:MAG: ABC transporter ATP-binding protein [Erysipelotrichales bacterium]|nr:ABC transporter ATP-binding protein [Erysipelotrichales bacterium]
MNNMQEEEFEGKKVEASLWIKVFKMIGENKKHLYFLAIFMIMQAAIDVVFPLMNSYALNNFVANPNVNFNHVTIFGVVYFILIIWQGINVYQYFKQAGRIEMGFSYSMRKKAFQKLQELSFSYYDKTSVGWIMARVTNDIARLAEIVSWSILDLVWSLFVMMGIVVVMLVVNWKLSLIVIATIPFIFVVSVYFQKRILKAYRTSRKLNSKITAAFNEGITGAKTTKTLVLEDSMFTEFKELTGEYRAKQIKASLFNALFTPIITSFSTIAIALLLNFGGNMVIMGVIEFGTLALFVNYSQQFFDPLRQIAGLMAELQMAQANAERVMSLLETEPDIVDTPEVLEKYGDLLNPKFENYEELKGDVTFENVTFYYNENEIVLKNFNLDVKAGQTIALVGETGSGKSTIVNLICRFYEPKSGRILIDGKDIKDRSIGWLHHNLGYVLQTPFLFSGTVKENIRFGRNDATDEEVIEAAKLVNAHDFIMKLENGYDTDVNEGGSRLSTGEKQLISFARALIADPSLLILDEATSSIDTEKEKLIQDAIVTIQKNRTSFVVAHRLSTIVDADRILVLKHGEVIEDGTHQELMAKEGYYYRLYTNQFNEEQQNELLKLNKKRRQEELQSLSME